MDNTIRIGKVSSINYGNGTARVTYEDKSDSTTAELPFIAWEYWMPKINDQVLVAHLSNGTCSAVIIGPVWNKSNRPYKSGAGLYRKEMSNTKNRAVITFSEKDGVLRLRADHITFEAYSDNAEETVEHIRDIIDEEFPQLQQAVAVLQDDTNKTKGKLDLQAQIDALDKRLKAHGI